MPSAQRDICGPSHKISGIRSARSSRTAISDGTAASQFIDCPPQAIARQTTMLPAVLSKPVAGWSSWWQQQHGLLHPAFAKQQVFVARESAGSSSQHKSIPCCRASSIAYSGGRTPCSCAQSIRSASVWQQHDRQHCSAELQPQGQSMQGNISPLLALVPAGSGTPAAVTTYIANSTQAAQRRPIRRDIRRSRKRGPRTGEHIVCQEAWIDADNLLPALPNSQFTAHSDPTP
jgi:hypothetical protein